MRVVLDLDSGFVCLPTDYIPGLNRLVRSIPVGFGDLSIDVQLMRSGALAQLIPTPSILKFVAIPYASGGSIDFDGVPVVSGQFQVQNSQSDPSKFPLIQCGEDWSSAALAALFVADQEYVNLRGQYFWQVTGDPVGRWRSSRDFDVAVRNTLNAAAAAIPGALVFGQMFYLVNLTRLTGGNVVTDLDAQDISQLPNLAVVRVVIPNRGESSWQRQIDNTTPATDTEAGVIRPVNYDAVLRPYVLRRQSGF